MLTKRAQEEVFQGCAYPNAEPIAQICSLVPNGKYNLALRKKETGHNLKTWVITVGQEELETLLPGEWTDFEFLRTALALSFLEPYTTINGRQYVDPVHLHRSLITEKMDWHMDEDLPFSLSDSVKVIASLLHTDGNHFIAFAIYFDVQQVRIWNSLYTTIRPRTRVKLRRFIWGLYAQGLLHSDTSGDHGTVVL